MTASNAATVDFDAAFSSTYSQYVIVCSDLHPRTDNVELRCRTSTDGGSSYDSGGSDYRWGVVGRDGGNAGDESDASSASEIAINGTSAECQFGNAADESGWFRMWIFNPSGTTYDKNFAWLVGGSPISTGNGPLAYQGVGQRNATADVDSIQFFMSSGNLDGVFRLYGIANS